MSRAPLHAFMLLTTAALLLGLALAGCSTSGYRSTKVTGGSPSSPAPGLAAAGDPATRGAPGEELWVIAKPQGVEAMADAHGDDAPGCGTLAVYRPDGQMLPMPLKHTSVSAQVNGYIASVDVTQKFGNPYTDRIEAVYVFPLPENAGISEFVMTIGSRRIRGIIRERAEAEAIYREARRQGHVASLLTQERPNIFTQKVANIEPGMQIDVNIRYIHTLEYVDGWYEFVYPMVVGPRFNPPDEGNGIGATAFDNQQRDAQPTTVRYLKPTQRSPHDIDLSMHIDAGVRIEQAISTTHDIRQQRDCDTSMAVSLDPSDTIPNKDFVLRWRVAGDRLKAGILTERTDRGGYFTLMLYPPADDRQFARAPMEMIFVLDCSGSMSGQPLDQSKAAVKRALDRLQPADTFQIIRFSDNASSFGNRPVAATRDAVRRARRYVDDMRGGGGTMMIKGIRSALDFPHDEGRIRIVAFLTDGFIGNDADVLREVHDRLGASRIFSFGVGPSPNRYLMQRMAKMGRGAAAFLNSAQSGASVMGQFFDRSSKPALADVHLSWPGAKVEAVYPQCVPDLIAGRAVVLTGRYDGGLPDEVIVRGRSGGRMVNIVVPVPLNQPQRRRDIDTIWARGRIADLYDRMAWSKRKEQLLADIRQTALDYGLMSQFTAFVAVDSAMRTSGSSGTTVHVGVPVPEGTRYDTTVSE